MAIFTQTLLRSVDATGADAALRELAHNLWTVADREVAGQRARTTATVRSGVSVEPPTLLGSVVLRELRENLTMGARFTRALAGMLRAGLSADEGARRVREAIAGRDAAFLHLIRRAIFERSASPYYPLLRAAGIEHGDVERMVRSDGVEGTLDRLFAAGVHVRLDEFKGLRPSTWPGFERPLTAKDFDNPLLNQHYEAFSGASGGTARRVVYDLDQISLENASEVQLLAELGALGGRAAMWRPVPPGSAGLRVAIRAAQRGYPLDKWFSQQPVSLAAAGPKYSALMLAAYSVGAACGRRIPWAEHVPVEEAWKIAEWLARNRSSAHSTFFDTNPASGVRICQAARSRGWDISGTVFRFGGEPYTAGKRRAVEEADCRGYSYYAMAEAGVVGMACGSPGDIDEMHLLTDKLALIERRKAVGEVGLTVNAFYLTSLLPSTQKILLNVESGDYGAVFDRSCGCPLDRLGFRRHLREIRSYEKLASEGMLFIGEDLVRIVDELLPGRFGGNATDYQFVEREENGLPRVDLHISPQVGLVDENELIETVLSALSSGGPARAMAARRWRDSNTLRVRREAPLVTSAAKILPLHLDRN
jgi:hypothetical protein